jgi:hypothetical protein
MTAVTIASAVGRLPETMPVAAMAVDALSEAPERVPMWACADRVALVLAMAPVAAPVTAVASTEGDAVSVAPEEIPTSPETVRAAAAASVALAPDDTLPAAESAQAAPRSTLPTSPLVVNPSAETSAEPSREDSPEIPTIPLAARTTGPAMDAWAAMPTIPSPMVVALPPMADPVS